jgi:predicted tellurium resistance membrane protein TerC
MEELLTLAATPAVWMALVTLIIMEVVLGIDNLIFISILSNKLPEEQRNKARRIGILLALGLRLGLLASVAWIVHLTEPVFTVLEHPFSWRDLILIGGGLFLLWKATKEIHHNVDPDPVEDVFAAKPTMVSFKGVVTQILLLDLVFSVDSIITAVGMTDHVPVMVIAVIVAVTVMLLAANPLSEFINAHPTVVMLALSFLVMIGMTLIAEGFGAHVPKGYIYTAMAFSAGVEGLNIFAKKARARKKAAAAK